MSSPQLALVLGSGTARGLAHIGVLKVCEREGLPIDLIVGTSIGALIGGAWASGMAAQEIEEVALALGSWRLLLLADPALPNGALVKGRRVEAMIREHVGDSTFADLPVPFACVAADVVSRQQVVLNEGDLASAIRASISAPLLFAPVAREARLLVDGAVSNPIPVDVAKAMGADRVIAVTTHGPLSTELPVYTTAADELDSDAPTVRGFSEAAYSKALSLVERTLEPSSVRQVTSASLGLMQCGLAEAQLRAADLVIAPRLDGSHFYSFHEAAKLIAAGERAAEAALVGLEKLRAARYV